MQGGWVGGWPGDPLWLLWPWHGGVYMCVGRGGGVPHGRERDGRGAVEPSLWWLPVVSIWVHGRAVALHIGCVDRVAALGGMAALEGAT